MAKDNIKKIKLLFGLIYFKIDTLTTQWSFRLFGIPLLQSKIKNILRSNETIYLLGFIPIFKHKILNRLQKRYMSVISNKYSQYSNYIVFASGCGEIFWAFSHIQEFIQKEKIENFAIICDRKILKDIYNLFNLKYPIFIEKDCSGLLLNYKNELQNKTFYVPLNYKYFGQNEKNIIRNHVHYYEELLKQLGVKKQPIINNIEVTENIKEKIAHLAQDILKNKFVIIMPEARTIDELDIDFWKSLVIEIKKMGYEVFYNCSFIGNSIEGTTTMFLSFDEFIELSKYSDCLIGLRNGFLEILSLLSQKPTFVIYNSFNNFAQNKLTGKQALEGFTMKKLPYSKNIIKEYLYSEKSYNQILNQIISCVKNMEKNNVL